MKTKNLLKIFTTILYSVFLFSSCGDKKQEVITEAAAVKVKTATAIQQLVEDNVSYTANIESDVKNKIAPARGGRIQTIYVEVGDRVSKGQALAKMEPHDLDQQVSRLNSLKKDHERYAELLKVGGIAQQQVDQIVTEIEVLESAIADTKNNTTLRSPITGIITERNYDSGDVYGAQPILVVEKLNPLKAIVYVSEKYFPIVKKGMSVDITVDVYGDEVFEGKVSLIYPTVDATTHTFGVEIEVNNKNNKLAPGMYSRVTLNLGDNDRVILPDIAVVKQSGSNDRYIYIVDGDKVRYSKVTLGTRIGENVVVLSGASAGDEVVTAGQTRLIDGSQIEVINE
jgi:RND family efflux transporter, MFP subunit